MVVHETPAQGIGPRCSGMYRRGREGAFKAFDCHTWRNQKLETGRPASPATEKEHPAAVVRRLPLPILGPGPERLLPATHIRRIGSPGAEADRYGEEHWVAYLCAMLSVAVD